MDPADEQLIKARAHLDGAIVWFATFYGWEAAVEMLKSSIEVAEARAKTEKEQNGIFRPVTQSFMTH